MFKRKMAAIAGAATLLVGFTGYGLAQAAIPNSTTGEFTACVANFTRTVKIIDKEAGETCGYGYTEETFNQTGPQGVPGPAGPQGPAGPAGTASAVYVHTIVDQVPVGTAYTDHWYRCPDGDISLSAAVYREGWSYQRTGMYEQTIVPANGAVTVAAYDDTGARVSIGYPQWGNGTPEAPFMNDADHPTRYNVTLKCQGV